MKKTSVIFSFIMIAAIAGLSVISCNSAVQEEFGTLVLDVADGCRAIGADGLPVLGDSKIRVEGKGEISGAFKKDFLSADGVSLSFPVGDTVELRVSVLTPSARWSSAPLTLKVESGTNAVSVKLSKKTAALHNFLFSYNFDADSNSPASFSLKFKDGTDIFLTCKRLRERSPLLSATVRAVFIFSMPNPHPIRSRNTGRCFFITAKEKIRKRFLCLPETE